MLHFDNHDTSLHGYTSFYIWLLIDIYVFHIPVILFKFLIIQYVQQLTNQHD